MNITISDDEMEMEETVRVIWSKTVKIHRFTMKRSEPFLTIFKALAEEYKVGIDEIQILRNDVEVFKTDTYESLNVRVIDNIVANLKKPETVNLDQKLSGTICVKIQRKDKKQPIVFYLKPNQPFEHLIAACADKLALPVEKIKLWCDGEIIRKCDTLQILDIDSEVSFDLS